MTAPLLEGDESFVELKRFMINIYFYTGMDLDHDLDN